MKTKTKIKSDVPRGHSDLKPPLLSVVIASFNESIDVLIEALDSVRAQSFKDFECIVVDDSTDLESAEACRAFCEEDSRFIYIHPSERLGLSRSLNLGLGMVRGRFIARFDADDVCLPFRFERQLAFLHEHPHIDVVGSNIEISDEAGRVIAFRKYPQRHETIVRRMHLTATLANPTVMLRRGSYDRLGGYNPEFTFAEDLELWLRWANGGTKFANIQENLVRYRKQDARRNRSHWILNLRARLINFDLSHILTRILGIMAVAFWLVIPSRVQAVAFQAAMLIKVEE